MKSFDSHPFCFGLSCRITYIVLVSLLHAFASQSLESDYEVTLDDSLKADVVVSCDTSW